MTEGLDLSRARSELASLHRLIQIVTDKRVLGMETEDPARELAILRQAVAYVEARLLRLTPIIAR